MEKPHGFMRLFFIGVPEKSDALVR